MFFSLSVNLVKHSEVELRSFTISNGAPHIHFQANESKAHFTPQELQASQNCIKLSV